MRDDELLGRYLLGELSAEDEALLEARLIQDGDLFERAEALEADLLEEHARGGLSAAQRARLGRHLASSPATRSQRAVVRGLGTIAAQERPARLLTGPWGRTDLSRPWVRGLAAAAMLAIAVASVWIGRQTVSLPRQEEQARVAAPAPPPMPVPAPVPPAPAPAQDRIAEAEPAAEPAVSAPAPAPAPPPLVFELALTVLRGPEDGVKELRIPAGTGQVDIHLPLSPEDAVLSSFEIVVRNAADEEVIRRSDLRPVKTGEGADLVLSVEARLLRAGRYSVEVYGDGEGLAFPEFQVVEP